MTTSASEHPLKLAADRALAKADERGGADVVRWLAADHCWTVGSSRPTETSGASYLIRRKHDVTNGSDPSKRTRTGFGWAFILTCDCPTEASGYAVCWHKAAVYRWWQKYRRVDGDAYGDLPPHSNANAALHATEAYDRLPEREPDNSLDAPLDRFYDGVDESDDLNPNPLGYPKWSDALSRLSDAGPSPEDWNDPRNRELPW